MDFDGTAEIVAVAGPSGGPHVRVFTGAGIDRGSFFAFDPDYRGGAFLAAAAGRIFVAPDSVRRVVPRTAQLFALLALVPESLRTVLHP